MPKLNINLFLDDEYDDVRQIVKPKRRLAKSKASHRPKGTTQQIVAELAAQSDEIETHNFTYRASRHERAWMMDSLGGFYEQQWFDDVLRLVKGGKEASVYQCLGNATSGARFLAAKIYRPRMFRNLRKDHLYREGRSNLDSDGNEITEDGMLNAMRKRSKYGLQLLHTSWLAYEYKALQILHAAGGDVPIVYASSDNCILMEYIGGEDLAAPTLNEVQLERQEALALFVRALKNIEIMLANNLVHADLSAYNILYWQGQIKLIDFPQAIHPDQNRNSYQIFERDVTRICEYFARQGVPSRPRKIATDMWTAYNRRLGPDVHPALLDDQDEGDRLYWDKLVKGRSNG
ncbi:MAG TPA: RIO1 family regulatory kinase/ATPase [Anaerolineales bacterium]|nr:RIO1 family regulatory kinase/ATPase [Anaerolineales bacterium]